MSGIFGVILLNGKFKDALDKARIKTLLERLTRSNEIRGTIATGLAVVGENSIRTIKRGIKASTFVENHEFKSFLDSVNLATTYSFMGHCREVGKGSPRNADNNSPMLAGNILGVHDGYVTNSDTLFRTFSDYFKRTGKSDSEIIFKLFNHKHTSGVKPFTAALQKVYQETHGLSAYACVSACVPSVVCLARNTGNPLEVISYEDSGIVVFSSSEHHIISAAKSVDLVNGKKVPLTLGKGLVICANKNQYMEVSLDKG